MNIEKLKLISNINVMIFGDLMVDKYLIGDMKRISPEAPVPILEITDRQMKLGGAGNVINNIISLGANARVLACSGTDPDGDWILSQLNSFGADTTYVKQYDMVKTIIKTRLVARNQQLLRLDEEIIEEIPLDYEEYVRTHISQIFNGIDAVIISDYAKGAVTKSLTQIIIAYAKNKKIPVIVDPKGKDFSKYMGATVCTPNLNELSVVSNHIIKTEDDITRYSFEQLNNLKLDYLVLTRSEKGISVFEKGSESKRDFPAIVKDVIDVTGAGDTVVAVIAITLVLGFEIGDCCMLANVAASVVCSKFGSATLSKNDLLKGFVESDTYKLIDINSANYIVTSLKEQGKTVVFTNGCFDLLHAGHISSFKQAKIFGDVLIVAVNSDESVKKIKGNNRPIISEKDRITMLCSLEIIDYVILMEDDTPANIIRMIQPDIVVKGKDWESKNIPEKIIIDNYGGCMKFISLEKGLSTTQIINNILNSDGNR